MAAYTLTKRQLQHMQKVLTDTMANVLNPKKREKQAKLLAEIEALLNQDCAGAQHASR